MVDETQAESGVPLAELTSADLTTEQLASWQAAVLGHGQGLQVRAKTTGAKRALDAQLTLQAGLDALLAHEAASLQVRYMYDGNWWADTLVVLPNGGVRLLRAALPDLP